MLAQIVQMIEAPKRYFLTDGQMNGVLNWIVILGTWYIIWYDAVACSHKEVTKSKFYTNLKIQLAEQGNFQIQTQFKCIS